MVSRLLARLAQKTRDTGLERFRYVSDGGFVELASVSSTRYSCIQTGTGNGSDISWKADWSIGLLFVHPVDGLR